MPIIPSLSKVPCFNPQHRHKQLKHKDWAVFHPQHLSSVLRFQIRWNPPNHCDVAVLRMKARGIAKGLMANAPYQREPIGYGNKPLIIVTAFVRKWPRIPKRRLFQQNLI